MSSTATVAVTVLAACGCWETSHHRTTLCLTARLYFIYTATRKSISVLFCFVFFFSAIAKGTELIKARNMAGKRRRPAPAGLFLEGGGLTGSPALDGNKICHGTHPLSYNRQSFYKKNALIVRAVGILGCYQR